MSPIVPHMAEDAWQNIPYKPQPVKESVFDKGWVKENERFSVYDNIKWDRIRLLRNDVNRCIGKRHSFYYFFDLFIYLFIYYFVYSLLLISLLHSYSLLGPLLHFSIPHIYFSPFLLISLHFFYPFLPLCPTPYPLLIPHLTHFLPIPIFRTVQNVHVLPS